jgi:hypothetical protein
MQADPANSINTVPPAGNADEMGAGAGQVKGFVKLMILNGIQGWFCNKNIKMIYKILVVIIIFVGNITFTCGEWLDNRPPTLYDILDL